eukprot:scaffold4025_cov101-Isochrysis_galbana.AAC.2
MHNARPGCGACTRLFLFLRRIRTSSSARVEFTAPGFSPVFTRGLVVRGERGAGREARSGGGDQQGAGGGGGGGGGRGVYMSAAAVEYAVTYQPTIS